MKSSNYSETFQTEKKQGISSSYCIGSKFWDNLNLYGENKQDIPKDNMPKANPPKANVPKADN